MTPRLRASLCFALLLVASAWATKAASLSYPVLMAYFDPESAALTPMARSVVSAVVAQEGYKASPVLVIGHCDGSEEAAGTGLRLSLRRAEAVAAALVGAGTPPALVTTEARGASDPAVPRGPGAAEPLNRRVEIWIED